jgi:hypothetical protein
VLYKLIATATQASYDVIGLLQQGAARFAMQTDWAMRRNTSCPSIQLGASITDLALQMGDVPVIPNNDRPTWAWSNLLQAGDLVATPNLLQAIASGRVLGYSCYKLVMLVVTCVAPVYLVLHHGVLLKGSAQYRHLPQGQQLVTCQHAAYVVVFGLHIVPQTYLAIRTFFKLWTAQYVMGSELTLLRDRDVARCSVSARGMCAQRGQVELGAVPAPLAVLCGARGCHLVAERMVSATVCENATLACVSLVYLQLPITITDYQSRASGAPCKEPHVGS